MRNVCTGKFILKLMNVLHPALYTHQNRQDRQDVKKKRAFKANLKGSHTIHRSASAEEMKAELSKKYPTMKRGEGDADVSIDRESEVDVESSAPGGSATEV